LSSEPQKSSVGEILSFESTTAQYTCGGGRAGRLRRAMVCEVRDLGIIVRSPGCDHALIPSVHDRRCYLVDLRGTRYLVTGEYSDAEGEPCP
jgi:hypothetical protein